MLACLHVQMEMAALQGVVNNKQALLSQALMELEAEGAELPKLPQLLQAVAESEEQVPPVYGCKLPV